MISKKQKIKFDLPIQIGYWVYQLAKLHMLCFYYDVVDKYVDRSNYGLLEMDTDSLYMELSGDELDNLIKPELYEEWEDDKYSWFPHPENMSWDKRTPGNEFVIRERERREREREREITIP